MNNKRVPPSVAQFAVSERAELLARIAELEARYQRDVCGLNNEGDPIGGDPAGGYANDNARLRAELAAIKAQEPVGFADITIRSFAKYKSAIHCLPMYAAPVSEAKAQGVVLDGSQLAGLLEQVRLDDDEAKPHGSGAAYWNNAVIACQVAIRDALAAPVQQVSVPQCVLDWFEAKQAHVTAVDAYNARLAFVREHMPLGTSVDPEYQIMEAADRKARSLVGPMFSGLRDLAAAPAAPAADAGLVEAFCKVEQALDLIGGIRHGKNVTQDELWQSCELLDAALAAHSAKGVV